MPRAKKAKMTKSTFVRSMGNAPAKDVVAAAAQQGMKLTTAYVYVVRSSDKTKGGRGGGAGRRTRGGRSNSHAEAELRRAIAELGLSRARQVMQEVERAFVAR
jgi:hypothetical protein